MKKFILLVTASILTVIIHNAAADPALQGVKATMILKNFASPFWVTIKEGGEAAAVDLGLDLTILAPIKSDNNEEQTQMVEQAIVSGADIVIIAPGDSMGIIPAMEKLQEEGIPVVNLNTRIGGDQKLWDTFVAIENEEMGYITAKRLMELIDGKGEILVIEGVPAAQTSIDIIRGALKGIGEFPDVAIVAQQPADYNRAKAMDVVQNLLQAHPTVKAIFCANDEMALGAVAAVEAAGKGGDILISGLNANPDAITAIKDGKLTISCDTSTYQQGYEAVAAAVKILKNEPVPEWVRVPIKVVGKEDL